MADLCRRSESRAPKPRPALPRLAAAVAVALAVFWGATAARAAEPVLVFAAASLQEALEAVAAAYREETGRQVTLSYAGSGALARQIGQGAPADLFVSADRAWTDRALGEGQLRPETVTTLMSNTLVLVAPADAAPGDAAPGGADPGGAPPADPLASPSSLLDALGGGRLAMGEPASVPAGAYARAALTSAGLWETAAPHLALAENVRAALALVSRGEAPLGIVYATDAAAEPGVRVVAPIPPASHPPIAYQGAVTASSANPDAAAFLDYLTSPAASAIFARMGFLPAPAGG